VQLKDEDFSGTPGAPASVVSASVVSGSGSAAEYCAVTGYIQPQIQFELRLPTKTWNGRFLQAGCGGFCGRVPIDSTNDALARGFAVVAQNMGHFSGGDALWGSVVQLREDYGRRSTHVVALASKA